MSAIISVENLSKTYQLRHRDAPYRTLREELMQLFRSPLSQMRRTHTETLWALKDVSFDVAAGEVIGVIGRNGAGKSTLLKILSRITEPTTGCIKLKGRVGSLLEVGTGFHPELTGRENIFLNGTILGMRRQDITARFDEIVSFAEVERFLDTPVKHYSSGMYMRLAFAVAAHLQPDILIVDEVLAVGDSAFQKKCLGKIGEVARGGRTVLFVSHNMSAVRELCDRVILLKAGQIEVDARVDSDALRLYEQDGARGSNEWVRPEHAAATPLVFTKLRCELTGEQPFHRLRVQADLQSHGSHQPAFIAVDVSHRNRTPIFQALPTQEPFITCCEEQTTLTLDIELPPMVPGSYDVDIWAGPHYTHTYDLVRSAVTFDILTSPTAGRTVPHTPDHGYVVPHTSVIMATTGTNAYACKG